MNARPGAPRRRPQALRAAVVVLLAAVACSVAVAPGASAAPAGDGGDRPRVLVVSMPRLTWDRLEQADTPVIDGFVERAAVASTSTRTVGARTTPGDAYLTIGAGNRTTSVTSPAGDAGSVLMPPEATSGGTAAEVFQRLTGVPATGRLLGLDFARVRERNEELLYGSVPGSMGQALADAGIPAGAVANADLSFDGPPQRQAALAVLDEDGQAPLGEVGPTLLVADPAAAAGVRLDPEVVMNAARRSLEEGAELLLVEMSDLERAERARDAATDAAGDRLFEDALSDADALFGRLLAEVDPDRDLVLLVAPTAPLAGEELTVFAMAGPGVETGWARSSTTRRDGYVSLTDLAPTALGFLGVEPGEGMSDTAVTSSGDGATASDRVAQMVTANERAVFRDDAVGPLTVSFIVVLVVMLALVVLGVAARPGWLPALRYLALLVMAVPAATYLGGLLRYGSFTVATYGLALLAMAAAIAAVCWALGRGDDQGPPVLVAAVTVVVLAADILTGGHLQLDTIFGYSPIVAGRFAGFGNQAFSLIAVSTLLVACGAWALWGERRPASTGLRLPATLVLFAVVVVLVGAPTLGSDVGGVLASVPAFTVAALLLTGRRIRLRTVGAIAGATLVVLVVFAAIDLSRPADSRTHLGRFAQRVLDGEAWLILQRKLDANLSVLTSTVWALVIPAALLFFAYLTWRPNSVLRRVNAEHPTFRAFGISAITLGLVAWALNDSGVSMPAIMLAVALPYTAVLAMGVQPDDRGAPGEEASGAAESGHGAAGPPAGERPRSGTAAGEAAQQGDRDGAVVP